MTLRANLREKSRAKLRERLREKFPAKLWASLLAIALCAFSVAAAQAQAPEKQEHVVSLQELNTHASQSAETRQANETAIRRLLSSDAGQQALKSVHVDYQRVDKAIGQLSDDDLTKLAERSRHVENDFAAGFLTPKQWAYIILATVVIVTIIVIVT